MMLSYFAEKFFITLSYSIFVCCSNLLSPFTIIYFRQEDQRYKPRFRRKYLIDDLRLYGILLSRFVSGFGIVDIAKPTKRLSVPEDLRFRNDL